MFQPRSSQQPFSYTREEQQENFDCYASNHPNQLLPAAVGLRGAEFGVGAFPGAGAEAGHHIVTVAGGGGGATMTPAAAAALLNHHIHHYDHQHHHRHHQLLLLHYAATPSADSTTSSPSVAAAEDAFDFSAYQLPNHLAHRHKLYSPSQHPPPSSSDAAFHTNNHLYSHAATAEHLQQATEVKMEDNVAAAASDDLAAQQAAARDYRPQLKGPLVGYRLSSNVIAEEYAKADPIYVEKTLALPKTYSHYRPILGDGNCGWRAIAYAYFETLIASGSVSKIDEEHDRIKSLNDDIATVGGYDQYVWEDMVDETLALLKKVRDMVGQGNQEGALTCLHDSFNDGDVSSAIVYHMRLLAATYLKGNAAEFEPFANNGVQNHCSGTIEPVDREIDHLGVTMLVGVLLKPAGFVLEIAYLDRSPGDEVNVYRFPDEANGQEESTLGPIIRLLFRPDHYDIIYKAHPQPLPPSVTEMQVYHMAAPPTMQPLSQWGLDGAADGTDFDILAMIPGFDQDPSSSQRQEKLITFVDSYASSPSVPAPWTIPQSYTPPQVIETPPSSAAPVQYSQEQQQQQQQQLLPPHGGGRQDSPTTTLSAHNQYHQVQQDQEHPIRFSSHCWRTTKPSGGGTREFLPTVAVTAAAAATATGGAEEQTLQTPTMRNSPFNKIHFNNPDFQPQEYRPTDDQAAKGTAQKRRHEQNAKKPKKAAPPEPKTVGRT